MEIKPNLYQTLAAQPTLKGRSLEMIIWDLASRMIMETKMNVVDGVKQYIISVYAFRDRNPESDKLKDNTTVFTLIIDDVHQVANLNYRDFAQNYTWGIVFTEVKIIEDVFRFYTDRVENRTNDITNNLFSIAVFTNSRLEPDHTIEFTSYDFERDDGIRLVLDDNGLLEIPFDGIERLKLNCDLSVAKQDAQIRLCQRMVCLVYTAIRLDGNSVGFLFDQDKQEIQIWSPDLETSEKKLLLTYQPKREIATFETRRGWQEVEITKEQFRTHFAAPIQRYRQLFTSALQAVSRWDEWLQ